MGVQRNGGTTPSGGPTATNMNLTIATQNIHALGPDWDKRRGVLVDGLRQLNADVLLLQKTRAPEDADSVANLLGEGYQVADSARREPNGQGISIASRWPIRRTHEVDLSIASERTGNFACTALIAEIDAPQPIGRLLVANHFPDFQADHELERERQAVLLVREISELLELADAHVIIGGDLDAEPDAASLRFLMGKQSLDGMSVCYRNAWDFLPASAEVGTFARSNPLAPPAWPFDRIDHLLVRCGRDGQPTLEITGCDRIFTHPVNDIHASNHFGLVMRLRTRSDAE